MQEIILPKQCVLLEQCFKRVEGLTLLCAIQVIDSAMSENNKKWFLQFKEEEVDDPNAIVKDKEEKKYTVPAHMDLQATMKIFMYRRKKFSAVFKKYQLPKDDGSDFIKLVKGIINLRNDIIGHMDGEAVENKYAEMDTEQKLLLLFKFRDGIMKFTRFLSYFPEECGKDGKNYWEQAKNEREEAEKMVHIYQYNVETTIEKEGWDMTVSRFEELCKKLHIAYRSDDEGNSYFYTQDYKKSVRAIYVLSGQKEDVVTTPEEPIVEEKKKGINYLAIILSAIAVLLLVLILVLWRNGKDDAQVKQPPTQNQQQQEEQAEEQIDVQGKVEEETPAPAVKKMRGTGKLAGFVVTVDQEPGEYITFNYENDNSTAYSLGWAFAAEVIVVTTKGEYYGSVFERNVKIEKGATGSFHVSFEKEFEGKIKKITIRNVLPLGDMGLPTEGGTEGLSLKIPIEYYEE